MCMGHCHLFSLISGSGLIRDIVGVGIIYLFFFLRNNGAMTRDEMAYLRVSLRICQERLKMIFKCGRQVYF
jgi:hypothetical protein